MRRYSTETRTRKYVKVDGFLSFAGKYIKKLLGTGLDVVKIASKMAVHKGGEFIGIKIADAKIVKKEAGEEIIISSEKRDEILNKSRKVL